MCHMPSWWVCRFCCLVSHDRLQVDRCSWAVGAALHPPYSTVHGCECALCHTTPCQPKISKKLSCAFGCLPEYAGRWHFRMVVSFKCWEYEHWFNASCAMEISWACQLAAPCPCHGKKCVTGHVPQGGDDVSYVSTWSKVTR